ncbi:hypothetical protein BGX27_001916 [Mortierella sp. AM989]|nr:hypothetical protein BGX27_001916 [Mortierella sp. AM989]
MNVNTSRSTASTSKPSQQSPSRQPRGPRSLPPRPTRSTVPAPLPSSSLPLTTKKERKKLRKLMAAALKSSPQEAAPPSPSSIMANWPSTSSPVAEPAPSHHFNATPIPGPRLSSFDLELQPAMVGDTAIVIGNKISKKAAGECILRATVFILNRGFTYITKDLFMQLYRSSFGCPKLANQPMAYDGGFLDSKALSLILETETIRGTKYYRLHHAYFKRAGMKGIPSLEELAQSKRYEDRSKSDLPPVQALEPQVLSTLLEDYDTRFINIGNLFPDLCPSRFDKASSLSEFSDFLPIWYPEIYVPAAVLSSINSKAKPIPDGQIGQLQGAILPLNLFSSLLARAKGAGMSSKRARNVLLKHSARVLQPLEDERLKKRRRILEAHPPLDGFSSTSTSSLDASASIPSPRQIKQSKDKGRAIEPSPIAIESSPIATEFYPIAFELSPLATTSKMAVDMETDTQLPGSSFSTREASTSKTTHIIDAASGIADAASDMAETTPSANQQTRTHVFTEPMDVTGSIHIQGQDRAPNSETPGLTKSSTSQLRGMAWKERFKPYSRLSENNGGSALSRNSISQKRVMPSHSKTSGSEGGGSVENSNQKKEIKPLGYIPPSGDSIFTLPRPILPPLEGKAGPMSGMPPMAPFDPSISSIGLEESNMIMSGTLLRPTRDQILNERREAFDKIVEYVWKLPMRIS